MLQPTLPDLNELTWRKSLRSPKPTEKVLESDDKRFKRMFNLATRIVFEKPKAMITRVYFYAYNINSLIDGTINKVKHIALMAESATNDKYTLTEMFKQEDVREFVQAMVKEVCDHKDREHWELFGRKFMPAGSKTIMAVWSFKKKRYPDGRVLKHKTRLCAHGGMQRWGIDFWEAYAPVVNWISVRLLLILAIIHGLGTKSDR